MKKENLFVRLFPALRHLNIPNAITTLGLVLGLFACYFLTQGNLRMAIFLLFLAGLADLFDGFVAVKLNQQSEFGQYVDTLVDFFTCGIIPIWMVFDLLVEGSLPDSASNVIVVCALVFYCMCALWRLAYYNIIEADKFFTGLPVPGAMMMVTISVYFVVVFDLSVLITAATMLVIGTMMISGVVLKKYGIWQILMCVASLPFMAHVLFFY
jgi:CDP-diacylglycerol--serine O-phosphatidyltransferase